MVFQAEPAPGRRNALTNVAHIFATRFNIQIGIAFARD